MEIVTLAVDWPTLEGIGFPASWKIMENLENEKSIFQTWKNHGFWKKGQNHGKIMEFQDTSVEKSWNFFLSCTHIIQKKFALHAHVPMMIMKWVLFVSYFVEKVWCGGHSKKSKNLMIYHYKPSFLCHVDHGKSWTNHGIWFSETAWNPGYVQTCI